jgi:hypothetical protein
VLGRVQDDPEPVRRTIVVPSSVLRFETAGG